MEKIRVLVADDHPAFREGLSRLLKDEANLEVVAALEDGKEAVKWAEKFHPDVAILDVGMPILNGIEAAKLIRGASPSTKILMVSANAYDQQVIAAMRAGVDGYVLKNVPLNELVCAITMVNSGEGVFDFKATGRILRRLATRQTGLKQDVMRLGPREIQILKLTAKGTSNKEIADQLVISMRTIQSHWVNINKKLRVHSRTEAVVQALKEGWISPEDLANNDEKAN